MVRIIKNILYFIGMLLFVLFIVWNNVRELKGFFVNEKPLVLCKVFQTDNDRLKSIVEQVNGIKKERLRKLKMECSNSETLNVDFDKHPNPDASIVWGFYTECVSNNIVNGTLSNFFNLFYQNFSPDIQLSIISEIKGWKDDPQMPEDVRRLIDKSTQN